MPSSEAQSPKRQEEADPGTAPETTKTTTGASSPLHDTQTHGADGISGPDPAAQTSTEAEKQEITTTAAAAGKRGSNKSTPKSLSPVRKNKASSEKSTTTSPTKKDSAADALNATESFSQALATAEKGSRGGENDAGDSNSGNSSSRHSLAEEKENDALKAAERDKEVVEEFEYLLEKSQQLFLGLSELPEIGSKYWMPHFQRTFEVFTKLWRFQNQHRLLLEKPEHYGLKRWEVGEIASKIGQLYYRYYLRTSETNYLQEAYVFYDAIRERNYFKGEQEVRNSALMIKKLRYYARFIVVCLQLGNTSAMLQLLDEVKSLIDVYSATFNPVDKMEWSLVVKEMALFMQAVCSPVPTDEHGVMHQTNYRLVASRRKKPRPEKSGPRLRLQEAVIVGNRPTQIKFSELTLDMYHVLQMLEREPSAVLKDPAASGATTASTATEAASTTALTTAPATAEASAVAIAIADPAKQQQQQQQQQQQPDAKERAASTKQETADNAAAGTAGTGADNPDVVGAVPNEGGSKTEASSAAASVAGDKEKEKEKEKDAERDKDRGEKTAGKRVNPHKYVLYQPSFSHIQVYVASAFKEIGDQGCVLLYLSSEGSALENTDTDEGAGAGAGIGGTAAATHEYIGGISTSRRNAGDAGRDRSVEQQLVNTVHPADLVPYTRKPFFLIVESASAAAYRNMPNLFNQPLLCLLSPTAYPTTTNSSGGSIYTFFLYSPVVAFSVVSQIAKIGADKWLRLEAMFAGLEDLSFDLIVAHVTDPNTRRFLSDDFLRQIVCRHVVCCAVLALHRDFSRPENRPQSAPESFADVVSAPALRRKVRDVVEFCAAEELYRMEDEAPSSSLKEQQQRGSEDGDSDDNGGADDSSAGEERAVHASPVPATPALSPQQPVLSADNQEHSITTST